MDLKEIGRRIKEQRIYKKLSQEQLAELAELTPSYISGIESGHKIASTKNMINIAVILEMSLDFMFLSELEPHKDDVMVEQYLQEYRLIIDKLSDKDLVKKFVCYSIGLAEDMIKIEK